MYNKKHDFPIFKQRINGFPLTYLDSAATAQKMHVVLDAQNAFYTQYNANIHRGIHFFGEKATTEYERARHTVAQHIGAKKNEIIFTKGATEGINAVAQMIGINHITKGQSIVLTQLEHHANLLPWQYVAQQTGAVLKFIPVGMDGQLDMSTLDDLITKQTALVAMTHVSNALGTHVDIATIIKKAKNYGAKILIDACQSVPHQKIDVALLDCDFLVFSGHKLGGPTGIGVLYIKESLHEQLEPYQRGGNMVHNVTWHDATWAQSPHKFEAGTPPIAQAIGLGAAIEYLNAINFESLKSHEASLCAAAIERLSALKKVKLYGPLQQLMRTGHMITFNIAGIHAHDVAAYLDSQGIAVRAGYHCAQPLAETLGMHGSVRASFYLYTDRQDIDRLCNAVETLCGVE